MREYHYAIIIPAWNEAEFIESSIELISVAMNQVPYTGQLIVVDNNSTDDTAAIATAAGAQFVFEPINQISRSRNAGASAANASVYVFVDAASHIDARLLQRALDSIKHDKVVGGGAFISADRTPTTFERISFDGWNWLSNTFKLAAGCFIFTRADAFNELGGFSLHLTFLIIKEHRVTTSLRKLDWYTPAQMFKQLLFALLPGTMRSKRFMNTWYDESTQRTRKRNEP